MILTGFIDIIDLNYYLILDEFLSLSSWVCQKSLPKDEDDFRSQLCLYRTTYSVLYEFLIVHVLPCILHNGICSTEFDDCPSTYPLVSKVGTSKRISTVAYHQIRV